MHENAKKYQNQNRLMTTVTAAFYWVRSDETVHYSFNKTTGFYCFNV